MSLNDTPASERVHIAFFGIRNAGKSSLVNAVVSQEMSLVSDVKGTTTDPVRKAMELLPIGPVLIIDTPGIDDSGELGSKRVERAESILKETDIAVLVKEYGREPEKSETDLIRLFEDRGIPYVKALTKADLSGEEYRDAPRAENEIALSSKTGFHIKEFKELLGSYAEKNKGKEKKLVGDLLNPGDTVVLVIPIDESAPKGRLILPQQQTIRDILESGLSAVVCRDSELQDTLSGLKKKPGLVITDSQAYGRVSKIVPEDILLTSFSMLFARYKGDLFELKKGSDKLKTLKDGDRVLISEGCTHHRQCNDIGSVKIPGWIRDYCKAEPEFSFTSGRDFPEELKDYSLIVHCGGCMLNEAEMRFRINKAREAGVPIVNYGMAIAAMNGILDRCMEVFL